MVRTFISWNARIHIYTVHIWAVAMLDETTRKFVLCRPPPTIIHTDKKNKKAKKNIKVVVTTWHLAWLILNKMPLLFYSSNGHFVFVNRDVFVVSTKNKNPPRQKISNTKTSAIITTRVYTILVTMRSRLYQPLLLW